MDVSEVRADLLAEQDALDAVVAHLTEEQIHRPTPSPRWRVSEQLAHLTYFDKNAALAITDPDAFPATVHGLLEAAGNGGDEGMDAFTLDAWRNLPVDALLAAWRGGRDELAAASAGLADDARVAWYGPSMGAKSFLTARLMEVWAHGQDIIDALGPDHPVQRVPTDRLKHIAQLGYITRKWSYLNRGMEVPEGDVAVSITAPSGATWTWGEDDENTVTGPAEDFCLVVTQRRHADDTALEITGERARDWMVRAQAFAGPPTSGPYDRSA